VDAPLAIKPIELGERRRRRPRPRQLEAVELAMATGLTSRTARLLDDSSGLSATPATSPSPTWAWLTPVS
jgi:hypothetical protein